MNTTITTEIVTCCCCDATVRCSIVNDISGTGNMDLDLRPTDLTRTTIEHWLNQCPECGYIAESLADPIQRAQEIVASPRFKAIGADARIPELARRFAQYSLLIEFAPLFMGHNYLHAAWACDDANCPEQARAFRNQAAEILQELSLEPNDPHGDPDLCLLVDILRRADRFKEAWELATSLLSIPDVHEDDLSRTILQYQCQLCLDKDAACHTMAEAHLVKRRAD